MLATLVFSPVSSVLHRAGTPTQWELWVLLLQSQVPKIHMLQPKELSAPFCWKDGALGCRSWIPGYFSTLVIQAVLLSIGTSAAIIKEFLLGERDRLPHIYLGYHIKGVRVHLAGAFCSYLKALILEFSIEIRKVVIELFIFHFQGKHTKYEPSVLLPLQPKTSILRINDFPNLLLHREFSYYWLKWI